MVENPITSTPDLTRLRKSFGNSGRFKRRSLIPQNVPSARDEDCNDDEAERSSLLASERAIATSTPQISSPRRPSDMSSSPQKEHFQGCLKLYAENKINKDNAWNLQLIDFMSSMLRRHDARMDNLQTASTVVDASARIYSFRVDAVHHEVLKMAGGLSKAAQAKRGKKDEDGNEEAAVDGDAPAPVKKKKKRTKGAIANNPETLNGDFDTNDCIDPFFEKLAATTGDVTSSNRAFNATLSVQDKTYGLILRTDEPFLDCNKENVPEDINLSNRINISERLLPAFNPLDHICEPFTGFSISNWDPENEDVDKDRVNNWVEENRLNLSQQALAFDVNAEVEPIPLEDQNNDLLEDEPLGGIESDEEVDVAVAQCVAIAKGVGVGGVRLADMRPSRPMDSKLEYSYCATIETAWAGPAHWRLKNNRASKMSERTQSTAGKVTLEGKKVRTKRQLDFMGAGLASDWHTETGDYEPTQPAKIMISRKTLATGHTWNETNFKTPVDRGLDESYFRKLFLRSKVMMMTKKDLERISKAELMPVTVEEPKDYDYNNENDASYCPNSAPDGDDWANEDGAAAGDLHDQVKSADSEDFGDMLEPPTKVAKIFIPYAMRAKKVDMKQLKTCTWQMLTQNSIPNKESVDKTTFFDIYSKLPSKLTPNMRESLSVPLALLSVLHLANEKGLILEKKDDLKDFGILGLIK